MTSEQKQYHLDAYVFICRHFTYKSAIEWDFTAIHQELCELEDQRNAAYGPADTVARRIVVDRG